MVILRICPPGKVSSSERRVVVQSPPSAVDPFLSTGRRRVNYSVRKSPPVDEKLASLQICGADGKKCSLSPDSAPSAPRAMVRTRQIIALVDDDEAAADGHLESSAGEIRLHRVALRDLRQEFDRAAALEAWKKKKNGGDES